VNTGRWKRLRLRRLRFTSWVLWILIAVGDRGYKLPCNNSEERLLTLNQRLVLQLMLGTSLLLLGGCRSVEDEAQKIPSVSLSKEKVKLDPSVVELKRLYKAAQSQYERRTVCLRAIDEGAIRRGVHIRSVDQIFGTKFESERGARKLDGIPVGGPDFKGTNCYRSEVAR
jgi:hypothetical protein